MIHRAKDLSPNQRTAIEGLLGRTMSEDEAISIRSANPASAPDWLRASWKSAKEEGVDQLSIEEIDFEIKAARVGRRHDEHSVGQ